MMGRNTQLGTFVPHHSHAVHSTAHANGVAERFVRTVRSECLDWLLILNQQRIEQVLAVFVYHYNGHRPH